MKYIIKDYDEILTKVNNMTINELLKVVVCPDIPIPCENLDTTLTSLLFYATNKENALKESSKLNDTLIAADLEYGAGCQIEGYTVFPSFRAICECDDESLTYKIGALTAINALEVGYNWSFAPCVDILGNKSNPVVSIRSAGEDIKKVIKHGKTYMKGMQDYGLISTLKHFPGDGFCIDDQHITTSVNPLSKTQWDNTFKKVYQELINEGVMTIMPGHISLPSIDKIDETTNLYPPATLSKYLLTDVLKGELGFNGIIVSDAVNMSGFCGYMNYYKACARFLMSGGDCLLFAHPDEEFYSEMNKCIEDNILSLDVLKNRAYRMLCFKKQYFENLKQFKNKKLDINGDELEQYVVNNSVKIIKDKVNLLPMKLNENSRVAHVVIYNDVANDYQFEVVQELSIKLANFVGSVETIKDPGPGKMLEIAKSNKYDLILCSVLNSHSYGTNSVKITGKMARNFMNGWTRYSTPCVFISYFDPYFIDSFNPIVDTIINTYGISKYTSDAIINILIQK